MASTAPTSADTPAVASAPLGLREKSKAKRRALIQRTAARLFAERGFEHTTLADVAEEAEVAARTVSGYFPSKLELATSFAAEIAARLASALSARPDADLVEVLDEWLIEEENTLDRELVRLNNAMYRSNPALRALRSAHVTEAAEAGRAALSARTGLPLEHPMFVICMAAFGAALAAYLTLLSEQEPTPELRVSLIKYLNSLIDAARQED